MNVDALIENLPHAKGTISVLQMKYIYNQIIENNISTCLEIGVASGVSSAILLGALNHNLAQGKIETSVLHSYDLFKVCYWNRNLRVGYAVKNMLTDVDYNWNLRTPATFLDLETYQKPNSIEFAFIDANHKHPWPALDILACLPYLKDDGIICLHDINLPLAHPKFFAYGAQKAFYVLEKCNKITTTAKIPNCGSIFVDGKKDYIDRKMREIIYTEPWQIEIEDKYLDYLDVKQQISQ